MGNIIDVINGEDNEFNLKFYKKRYDDEAKTYMYKIDIEKLDYEELQYIEEDILNINDRELNDKIKEIMDILRFIVMKKIDTIKQYTDYFNFNIGELYVLEIYNKDAKKNQERDNMDLNENYICEYNLDEMNKYKLVEKTNSYLSYIEKMLI